MYTGVSAYHYGCMLRAIKMCLFVTNPLVDINKILRSLFKLNEELLTKRIYRCRTTFILSIRTEKPNQTV